MSRKNPPRNSETAADSPWVIRVVARFLLMVHGGSQEDLARAAGLSPRTVSRCMNGQRTTAETLQRLAAAAGLTPRELDRLLDLVRGIEARREGGPGERAVPWERSRLQLPERLVEALEGWLLQRLEGLRHRVVSPGPLSREEAEAVWARLRPYPDAIRRELIEEVPDFQAWELAELLCERSAAAADDPAAALELADLALYVVTQGPSEGGLRNARLAHTWAHRGNALRVAGDLDGAGKALRTARRLRQKGGGVEAAPATEERLFAFEAALRVEQERPESRISDRPGRSDAERA